MRIDSFEFYYWGTNPSPFKNVFFWCAVPHCRFVLPYHDMEWRRETDSDYKSYRENGGIKTLCPSHCEEAQKLREEQEKENES